MFFSTAGPPTPPDMRGRGGLAGQQTINEGGGGAVPLLQSALDLLHMTICGLRFRRRDSGGCNCIECLDRQTAPEPFPLSHWTCSGEMPGPKRATLHNVL